MLLWIKEIEKKINLDDDKTTISWGCVQSLHYGTKACSKVTFEFLKPLLWFHELFSTLQIIYKIIGSHFKNFSDVRLQNILWSHCGLLLVYLICFLRVAQ